MRLVLCKTCNLGSGKRREIERCSPSYAVAALEDIQQAAASLVEREEPPDYDGNVRTREA